MLVWLFKKSFVWVGRVSLVVVEGEVEVELPLALALGEEVCEAVDVGDAVPEPVGELLSLGLHLSQYWA